MSMVIIILVDKKMFNLVWINLDLGR
uniref:Uncharacterized protein n=1 Tax=Triticum urartu TaxID=4572 RepID=A0A8R7JWP4_TRIUA